ncbi:MAG: cyclohydrolase FolE [Actinomycetota bacterium]
MNSDRVSAAVKELLDALGEDAERPDLAETPARAAAAWRELLGGRDENPLAHITAIPAADTFAGQVVSLRDITFRSVCEHHLLPFHGSVHLMYRSSGQVAGLSSFVRTIEALSSRLQLQERLTNQIADVITEGIAPEGVIVAVVARHGCVSDRGVRQADARTVTIASRGSYSGENENAAAALLLAPPTL